MHNTLLVNTAVARAVAGSGIGGCWAGGVRLSVAAEAAEAREEDVVMSGGSWPLPAGSSYPPRVGKSGRGRREGEPGPGVAPWGRAWRRGPAPGGAGEEGFPPGGGAGLASRAEAPGRGRSTPRLLGARWAGGQRFRGLARRAGTWGRPVTPPPGRPPNPPALSGPGVLLGPAPRRRPTPLRGCPVPGGPSCTRNRGARRRSRARPSAERGKGMLDVQMAPSTWALPGMEASVVTRVSPLRDGVRTRGHSRGR